MQGKYVCCITGVQVSEAQKDVGANHAVSGLKFKVLRPILDMGYAVLLSDVDIVTLQNPFDHLHRDCDVEGMSDGWDNATAYGGILSWFHDLCPNALNLCCWSVKRPLRISNVPLDC